MASPSFGRNSPQVPPRSPPFNLQIPAEVSIEVRLPPDFENRVYFTTSSSSKIDEIKSETLKQAGINQSLRSNYFIGISENDLFYVEFVKLCFVHLTVKTWIANKEVIRLVLAPKASTSLKPTYASLLSGSIYSRQKDGIWTEGNFKPSQKKDMSSPVDLPPRSRLGRGDLIVGSPPLVKERPAVPRRASPNSFEDSSPISKSSLAGAPISSTNLFIPSSPSSPLCMAVSNPSPKFDPQDPLSTIKIPLKFLTIETNSKSRIPIRFTFENESLCIPCNPKMPSSTLKSYVLSFLQRAIDAVNLGEILEPASSTLLNSSESVDKMVFSQLKIDPLSQLDQKKLVLLPHFKITRPGTSELYQKQAKKDASDGFDGSPRTNRRKDISIGVSRVPDDQNPYLTYKVDRSQVEFLLGGKPLVSGFSGSSGAGSNTDQWAQESILFRSKYFKIFNFSKLNSKIPSLQRCRIINWVLPDDFPSRFFIKIHFLGVEEIKTAQFEISDTIKSVVEKGILWRKRQLPDAKVSDFLIKLHGIDEYVSDKNVRIVDVMAVREAVKRGKHQASLVLVPISPDLPVSLDDFLKSDNELVDINEFPYQISRYQPGEASHIEDVNSSLKIRIMAMEFSSPDEAPGSPIQSRNGFGGPGLGGIGGLGNANSSSSSSSSSSSNISFSGGSNSSGSTNSYNSFEGNLFVTVSLLHGTELLAPPLSTSKVKGDSPLWIEWLSFDIQLKNIPRAARLQFIIWNEVAGKEEQIGWVNIMLFNHSLELISGNARIGLWNSSLESPMGSLSINPNPLMNLVVEFIRMSQPVVFDDEKFKMSTPPTIEILSQPKPEISLRLQALFKKDGLCKLSEEEKALIWQNRQFFLNNPNALIKTLMSAKWNDAYSVKEAHRLIANSPPLKPHLALELLGPNFADFKVRQFAVFCLQADLNESEELNELLLQLVQALKYEPYHDSPLARFLLRRAFSKRHPIGHTLFWHLQAEFKNAEISERYSLIAEAYLLGCGEHRNELVNEYRVINRLHKLAKMIQETPKGQRSALLIQKLKEEPLCETFRLPINSSITVKGIELHSCKVKESFTAPLWLVFNNTDKTAGSVPVLFKLGDDLRQDALTLQVIRFIDEIWKQEGLDLRLSPYRVTPTGTVMGFIEVVINASSMANIQKSDGGVKGVMSKSALHKWIKQQTKYDPNNPQSLVAYEEAVNNFVYSCAGYSVISYIIGLGDRHNDNIMVTKDGYLLHIDFAHFLGNIMKWKGFKRETAPFVLTDEIAQVMGGTKSDKFKLFTDLCCKAFNILRRHSQFFINLFTLMVSTGMPQLQNFEDINYLRNAFMLDLTNEDASSAFKKLIDESLSSVTTKLNHLFHVLANPDREGNS